MPRGRSRRSAWTICAAASSWSGVSGGASGGAAPISCRAGTRRTGLRAIVTSPRASRRRNAGVPSAAATVAPVRSSDASSSRWRELPTPLPAASAARPASVSSATSASFARRPSSAVGPSTSDSARAGVEQYSRAIHWASSTRSPGSEPGRTPSGSASRSGASSERSASPTTTPSVRWRPNGTRTTEPTPTSC